MRIRKRYPADLPDPSTVTPGTIIVCAGYGLWGEGQGWRQRTGRFAGPTWSSVLVETAALRKVRRTVTRLVFVLAAAYLGGTFGWTAARIGHPATTFDINLLTGSFFVAYVCLLVSVWGWLSVDDPRATPPTVGGVR